MPQKHRWLVLALLTLLLLSACTPGSPPDPDAVLLPAPTSAPVQPPQLPNATPSTPSGTQPEVITFAANSLDLTSFAPLIDAFMQEHPTIIVQTVTADSFFDAPDFGTIDRTYAQAADLSLVQFERVYSVRRAQRGMWRNLSPFIAADPAFDAADFYTSTLTFGSAGDATYFVPRGVNVSFLAYNRDLWEKYRLPPPEPTWTWSDLRAALARVDQLATAQPPLYGFMDDTGGIALNAEFAQAGINWATTSVDQAQLTTPAIIDIFRRTAALAQDHTLYLPKVASIDDLNANITTITQLIAAGQVFIFSPFFVDDSTAFKTGYMPDVAASTNPSVAASGYAISAGTQHPDAAWQLLSYLSRQDRATPAFQGVVPARRSAADATRFWDTKDPELAAVLRATLNRPLPPLPVPNAVYDQSQFLRDALQAILYQRQSPEAAAAAAQAALDQQVTAGVPPPATLEPIIVNTPIPLPAPAATSFRFAAVGLNRAALPPLIAQFQQQHPELAVQLVDARAGGGLGFTQVAQQSDCFAYFQPPPPAAATAVADLQPRLDADASFPRGDYPPGVLAPLQQNGRLLGFPLRIGLPSLHANPAVFAAAGLPLPTAASSWADLAATAQQLTSGRGAQQTLGFGIVRDLGAGARGLLRAQGVALATGDPPQPAFTSPSVQAALPPLLDLLRPSLPVSATLDTLVAQGQVALWLDTRPATPLTTSAEVDQLVPLPPPATGSVPVDVTSALFLSAQSQQPDACWTWLRFLADQPLSSAGDYPARVSQAQTDSFAQQAPAGAADVYAAALPSLQQPSSAAVAPDPLADDPLAARWFDQAVVQALAGADLPRALADAQATTAAYLACVQGGTDGAACARQVDPTYQEPGAGP